jgi:hypothetical protein
MLKGIMADLFRAITDYIDRTFPESRLIKGKFDAIQTQDRVEEIKALITFREPSIKQSLPGVILQTSQQVFIGITFARNSSDLLLLLGKKVLHAKTEKTGPKFSLMQYMFPKDYSSTKLLILTSLQSLDEFNTQWNTLKSLQSEFLKKLARLVDSVKD